MKLTEIIYLIPFSICAAVVFCAGFIYATWRRVEYIDMASLQGLVNTIKRAMKGKGE